MGVVERIAQAMHQERCGHADCVAMSAQDIRAAWAVVALLPTLGYINVVDAIALPRYKLMGDPPVMTESQDGVWVLATDLRRLGEVCPRCGAPGEHRDGCMAAARRLGEDSDQPTTRTTGGGYKPGEGTLGTSAQGYGRLGEDSDHA